MTRVAQLVCIAVILTINLAASAAESTKRVLIVVGPSSHPPGTHEVAAGARLVKYCLETAENVRGIRAEVVTAWPKDSASLADVATFVFSGDLFPPAVMPESARAMADLAKCMDRGAGIVCFHYATGLGAKQVPADGSDHPLLRWMGGYFATRTPQHAGIARIYPQAKVEPGTGPHPVLRGWKTFTLNDEPYFKNYFGKDGPAKNVTVLATSMLPPEAPKAEPVAWAIERPDRGRGMGVVMPHFYRNWRLDDLRTMIMNGVVWTAKLDVPSEGVKTSLPVLTQFNPGSVEPQPRK